jgi:hypothetical protein
MKTIITMKWGNSFHPFYVNILYNAVKKNVTGPLRFVCITDDSGGIVPEVECFDIKDLELGLSFEGSGAWKKIGIYQEKLFDISGEVLFLDLDTIVTGSLDDFFDFEGRFISLYSWPNWKVNFKMSLGLNAWKKRVGTGVFRFIVGDQVHLFDYFNRNPDKIKSLYANEERYVADYVHGSDFWPSNWILSFKRHLRQPILWDRFKQPLHPPADCKLVAFHGKPRPHALVPDRNQNWSKITRGGRGAVNWVRQNWIQYGYLDEYDEWCLRNL